MAKAVHVPKYANLPLRLALADLLGMTREQIDRDVRRITINIEAGNVTTIDVMLCVNDENVLTSVVRRLEEHEVIVNIHPTVEPIQEQATEVEPHETDERDLIP